MGPLSALRITLEHGVIFNYHVEMKPRNISLPDRMEKSLEGSLELMLWL